ncbi:MAG: glycosyltransferase [Oscillibacter sp.]|nr:glycosyltransferase [Oscillibacter sp.]
MNPSVSIIVPVYNAEAALRRCIESILHQTYSDFELLLVDDGSRDSSGVICDEYAAKDARIRVFHKENGGVSAARNLALDNARGTYLQFLDSDDWVTPDATRLFLRAAEEHQADLVISDFYRVVGERVSVKGDIEEDAVLSQEEYAEHMMANPADFYYGVLWNKLYRRDIVESHRLRMNEEINWCEDFLFNLEYIRWAKRFYALGVPLYYYVKTKGSLASQISLSKTVRMKLTMFEYYNRLYQEIFDEEEYEKHRLKVYRFMVDAAGDGATPPLSRKLGRERVQVQPETLTEEGVLAEAFRERKLLERCLEPEALANDLTLKEALVLLALGRDGFFGAKQDLAALAGISRSAMYRALQQLTTKEYVKVEKEGVTVFPAAHEILSRLEAAIADWQALLYSDFTEEELDQYKSLRRRTRENVRRALHEPSPSPIE